ncbi:Hypothetical protein A7982_00407 [Minicystis rosea]|nr:Hypothetical protein A7982_00407 [Minicystis rosea]
MRESILRSLHEAAELEHDIMCSYLYAAFTLKSGDDGGLRPEEVAAVARWRRTLIGIAVGEMSHLTAVWNITSALGGVPRFGRGNFPIEDGYLPASIVVALAPFDLDTLQHFVHLERPATSNEPDGRGFARARRFTRTIEAPRVTPMGTDYETVGAFYAELRASIVELAELLGEADTLCGDPALQMSPAEVALEGAKPVTSLASALEALDRIVTEGEGAPSYSETSHFQALATMRDEYQALLAANPAFVPAFPVARNPVLRRPPNPEGRVWIDDEEAAAVVDVASASYGLMLRLLAYSYSVPSPRPEKALAVELGIALMHVMTLLADHAARLPASAAVPGCHAGVTFTALRDAAPLPEGPAARRFFIERFSELASAASELPHGEGTRVTSAVTLLVRLARLAESELSRVARSAVPAAAPASPST